MNFALNDTNPKQFNVSILQMQPLHRRYTKTFKPCWQPSSINRTRLLILSFTALISFFLLLSQLIENDKSKPILYVHVRLYGATHDMILNSFELSNHHTMYRPNTNGKPIHYQVGQITMSDIEFGHFQEEELKRFINKLNDKKVTFIAIEDHFFDDVRMMKYFDTFTIIRDPFTRFMSYYNYVKLHKRKSIDDNSKYIFDSGWYYSNCETNYYVRYFNNIDDSTTVINETHLEKAKNIVINIDVLAIFEFKSTWKNIEYKYDIQLDKKHSRFYESNHANKLQTNDFARWFKEHNKFDIELYEYAVKIAMDRTSLE